MEHKPTEQQQAIIDAAADGSSIIVKAGAGCSKTSTISMFQSVLSGPATAVAFNVSIKKELEKRLDARHTALTANGLGHRAWQKVVRNKLVVDSGKSGEILKPMLDELKVEREDWVEMFSDVTKLTALGKHHGIIPKQAKSQYKGLSPDDDETWEDLAERHWIELTPMKLELIRAVLSESITQAYNGKIDFDDQIYMSVLFGAPHEQRHIMIVDEAQDLSPINHVQLKKCRPQQLIVVGDPRQAIYGFRGADYQSMDNIRQEFKNLDFLDLKLSLTFRCPKEVVARQKRHYPEFEAFHTNKAGTIRHFNEKPWSIKDFPQHENIAILCRNNAPIISLAFRLLSSGVPIQVLGRDIAKNLKNLLAKAINPSVRGTENLLKAIESWRAKEIEKAAGRQSKIEGVHERAESMIAVAENCSSLEQAQQAVDKIFEQEGRVVLSSGHKAKGLEWNNVTHLDPWRIPSKYARAAQEQGDDSLIIQENNLRYVIETRTKDVLTLASLEDFTES